MMAARHWPHGIAPSPSCCRSWEREARRTWLRSHRTRCALAGGDADVPAPAACGPASRTRADPRQSINPLAVGSSSPPMVSCEGEVTCNMLTCTCTCNMYMCTCACTCTCRNNSYAEPSAEQHAKQSTDSQSVPHWFMRHVFDLSFSISFRSRATNRLHLLTFEFEQSSN